MFSLRQDRLLLSLVSADSFHPLPAAEERSVFATLDPERRESWIRRAQAACLAPLPIATASGYFGQDPETQRAVLARREMLKALCLGTCALGEGRYIPRCADLLYQISEESEWNAPDGSWPDAAETAHDQHAVKTAALLATASAVLENRAEPAVRRARQAIAARFTSPLIDGTLQLPAEAEPEYLLNALTALLFTEREDKRRWLGLRRLLPCLEKAMNGIPTHGCRHGIEKHLQDALAFNDSFELLRAASGGEVEARDDERFVSMARTFPMLHIDRRWFLNPGGQSMQPAIDPDELYRLGVGARIRSVCSLAAYLNRVQPSPSQPTLYTDTGSLYRQILTGLYRGDFLQEAAHAPKHDRIDIPEMRLLAERGPDFFVALSGGGYGCACAGDYALFLNGRPVAVMSSLPDSDRHAPPLIDGCEQRPDGKASDIEVRCAPFYSLLTMDLASAYPGQAGVRSYQRTLMHMPGERAVRLIDVYDLEQPSAVTFRLITPLRPLEQDGRLLLSGIVELNWDTDLDCRIGTINPEPPFDTLYRVEWQTRERSSHQSISFVFQAADASGQAPAQSNI